MVCAPWKFVCWNLICDMLVLGDGPSASDWVGQDGKAVMDGIRAIVKRLERAH